MHALETSRQRDMMPEKRDGRIYRCFPDMLKTNNNMAKIHCDRDYLACS
jgi:hypothetical protein